ncbi:regulatory protein RecX [Sphingomonas edaphi]|nr:regulatory protein RecX [Sphingomonas edaphi]
MAMPAPRSRKSPPPLTQAKLEEMALAYVGRFATSRSKLVAYLARKVRERGWEGDAAPDPAALAGRLAGLGYIDDRAFALSKARSLTARGYGQRRVGQALSMAGIGEEDGAEARVHAEESCVEAALRYARRRSIGPFAKSTPDQVARAKALAAMVRAGHGFGLSRAIVNLEPGTEPDISSLEETC